MTDRVTDKQTFTTQSDHIAPVTQGIVDVLTSEIGKDLFPQLVHLEREAFERMKIELEFLAMFKCKNGHIQFLSTRIEPEPDAQLDA